MRAVPADNGLLCVDASVLVDALIPQGRFAAEARRVVAEGGLVAPELIDVEVIHALRRMVRSRELSDAMAQAGVATLATVSLIRRSHHPLLPRMWELRDNLSAYDATYVALAEALGCPLVTTDAKLAGAAGVRCEVIVLDS